MHWTSHFSHTSYFPSHYFLNMIHNCNTNPELLEDSHPLARLLRLALSTGSCFQTAQNPQTPKAKSPFRTCLGRSCPPAVKQVSGGKTKCQEAEIRHPGPSGAPLWLCTCVCGETKQKITFPCN